MPLHKPFQRLRLFLPSLTLILPLVLPEQPVLLQFPYKSIKIYVFWAVVFLPDPMVFLTFPRTVREFVFVRWPRAGRFLVCLIPLYAPISLILFIFITL